MARIICGVDIGAETLDAGIGRDGPWQQFARTTEGIAQLARFCRSHQASLVVMEATGGYERLAFAQLWASGLAVALVNPNAVMTDAIIKDVHASVPTLGVPVEILYAGSSDRDIETAFANSQKPGGALLVTVDPFFFTRRALIVTLAARHALPTVYFRREFAGGLVSYGTSVDNIHELIGIYTGRILKGEKPADLPVAQPTKCDLVINLVTARAIGLNVPPTLLALADEVIE